MSPQRVAVVGTGVIGASWTALFLAHGLSVTAYDPAPEAEDRLRAAIDAASPALERLGLQITASGLTFTGDIRTAAQDADFIQESGPEREDVKHDLLAALDEAAPPHAVIASSSSGMLPSTLQGMCAHHPERVLVGHPFNPAHLMPLVEVVGGKDTSPQAIEAAMTFYASLGKKPVHLRQELPGHLANRLQAALWREAYDLVRRGVASVADIDAAIAHGPGLRWALLGPLANQHLSGGPGGLGHVLAHLGPPAAEWMNDLGPTPSLTPDLVSALVTGVEAELAGIDTAVLAQRRDALLLDLLTRKSAADLP